MTSREVLRQIAEQMEAAAQQDPHFWSGLREELGRARMAHGTRQQRATQTAGPIVDVAVQVAPATREGATQTRQEAEASDQSASSSESEEPVARESTGEVTRGRQPRDEDEDSSRPTQPVRPAGPGTRTRNEECWNCRSTEHLLRDCPRTRHRIFCFRCGQRDVTVKCCPSCGEGWRAQGPYHPVYGHEGPGPSRRRGTSAEPAGRPG